MMRDEIQLKPQLYQSNNLRLPRLAMSKPDRASGAFVKGRKLPTDDQLSTMILFAIPPILSLIGISILAAIVVATIHVSRRWRG
jgi:hypothetical protein